MNRREKSESDWREKFVALGLNEQFEFIRRDWNSDHGKKALFKCRSCGETFSTWSLSEIIKGNQTRMICPVCGVASDGVDRWTRTAQCDEAMNFYAAGHSATETAQRFHLSKYQIEGEVKKRGITNGKDFRQRGREVNKRRHETAMKRFNNYIKNGGLDYTKIKNHHRSRAVKYGCEYDSSVTLEKLIERDGLRCALCGELCDPNDHRWECSGPLYPSIDHIIPMSEGGGHIWNNVQVAHMICNSIKNNKYEEEA